MQEAAMQQVALIPQPRHVAPQPGVCVLSGASPLVAEGGCERALALVREALGSPGPAAGAQVTLRIDPGLAELGPEGYRLTTAPDGATLAAPQEAGLLWAVQTLRQLMPAQALAPERASQQAWQLACVEIEDAPRFGWRGMMLDVARHFFPAATVKRLIDLCALHKLNRFHWHLTDDQGWRIEIRRYPHLTKVGSQRRESLIGHQRDMPARYDGTPHGGFYTQHEIREVVAYAQARGITVVPEIEMPGHATAAIAAYPELGNLGQRLEVATHWGIFENTFNVEEATFYFLRHVLEEVLGLFPSEYVHIGGDEAPKQQWNASPVAQQRMRELGLADADQLQSYFVRRIDAFLHSHGRRMVGWDEILEGGLAAHATVMSWRGEAGGIAAARQGHDVVMTPTHSTYFDQYQFENRGDESIGIGGYLPLERAYAYEPIPAELSPEEARHVLGTQGQLWTEYVIDEQQVDFKLFPRMCALAEVAWSMPERRSYQDFLARLPAHLERLDALGVRYAR
jgi:hexosaminidase